MYCLKKTSLKRLVSLMLCILLSVCCFSGIAIADPAEGEDNSDGVVPVGYVGIKLTKVGNPSPTKVRYRVDLTCSANVQYTNLKLDSVTISLTPSGTPVFSVGPLSYSYASATYSSSHTGIGYVVLTVGVGGSATVYVTTTNARANFVAPHGWNNINDLTDQPEIVYN